MRINPAIMVAAVGAALLAAAPARAADACPVAPRADVEVRTPTLDVAMNAVPEPVAYAPFPKAMETSLGPGWTINGLTVVRPLVKTQIFTADAKAGAQTCVWVTKAVVNFGFFEPAGVYISNKYKPGSCEFETIRGHENQHVGIHLNTRSKHVPMMREKVADALAKIMPVKASDPSEALRKIQAAMSEAVDDSIRDFQVETGQLNGMLDSTDSYLKLQSKCSNW